MAIGTVQHYEPTTVFDKRNKDQPREHDIIKVSVTPVVTLTAYNVLDQVGGLMEFALAGDTGYGSGIIRGITVVDQAIQNELYSLWLFDESVTVASDADTAAFSDTDLRQLIAVQSIVAADYHSATANSAAHIAVNIPFKLIEGGTSIFGALVAIATPDMVAVDDITVILHIEQF